jgi:integrase
MTRSLLKGRVSFADLCRHYLQHEVLNPARKQQKKAHTTAEDYNRIVTKRLSPRFGRKDALRIQPLEIESWLDSLQEGEKLQSPTLDKYRRQMFLVYKHGQRHGLIPRTMEANPLNFVRQSSTSDYEAITITAEKTFEILQLMPQPERTLTLLIAATGLRISECLGLKWQDIDYSRQKVFVRRAWTRGEIGRPKSKASKAPVPLHPVLAAFLREWHTRTVYAKPDDWVFPSEKLKGRQPRVANMLVEDYLRPAAVKAGVPELLAGQKVRFGFHNLRHSLAAFLVDSGTDPKTVQDMLRQADVQTTLKFYAHSKHETKLAAQAQVLQAILKTPVSEAVN